MPARRRPAQLGTLLATLLLASACGSQEPEPLTAMEPEVPADLCATVPAALRQGLVANATSDPTGNPTAACSLRSADGASTQVRAVVTWVQATDDASADEILDSQCRAIDGTELAQQASFAAKGADRACAAGSKADGADSATLAGVTGREVIVVRLSSKPAAGEPALKRGTKMIEGVLAALAS